MSLLSFPSLDNFDHSGLLNSPTQLGSWLKGAYEHKRRSDVRQNLHAPPHNPGPIRMDTCNTSLIYDCPITISSTSIPLVM